MTLDKLKSYNQVNKAYKHNYRELKDELHVNSELSYLNKEYIDNPSGEPYSKRIQNIIKQAKKNNTMSKVRKNAVYAYEVVLTFSREAEGSFDVYQWADKNIEWLKKTFNVGGNNNVISAMLHLDESGAPHIHAIVVPMDERGRLCASRFTPNPASLIKLQTDYAKEMECFKLERGEKRKSSKYTDLQDYFYKEFDEALAKELPLIRQQETIEEYRKRADEEYKRANVERMKAELELNNQREKFLTQISLLHKQLEEEKSNSKKTKEKLKALYGKMIDYIIENENVSDEKDAMELIKKDLQEYSTLKKAIDNYPDEKVRKKLQKTIKKVLDWYKVEQSEKKMDIDRYFGND